MQIHSRRRLRKNKVTLHSTNRPHANSDTRHTVVEGCIEEYGHCTLHSTNRPHASSDTRNSRGRLRKNKVTFYSTNRLHAKLRHQTQP